MRVLSIAVLALSLMVVTVGSVISSAGYGLAIPDWPLALGRMVPDPTRGRSRLGIHSPCPVADHRSGNSPPGEGFVDDCRRAPASAWNCHDGDHSGANCTGGLGVLQEFPGC